MPKQNHYYFLRTVKPTFNKCLVSFRLHIVFTLKKTQTTITTIFTAIMLRKLKHYSISVSFLLNYIFSRFSILYGFIFWVFFKKNFLQFFDGCTVHRVQAILSYIGLVWE